MDQASESLVGERRKDLAARGRVDGRSTINPGALLVALLVATACGVACAPLGVSVVAVFLLAGPHNWLEARYFLGRLPGRFGPLKYYGCFGLGGALVLTALFAALPWLARGAEWSESTWMTAIALWNSALIVWVAALAGWRSRIPPRRDWPWLVPGALALLAVNWLTPLWVNLALVYLHPLVALVFLDRELARQRSSWRAAYRRALWLLPVCLLGIAVVAHGAPPLEGRDIVSLQIQRHAGSEILSWVSPRLLVTWHAYLELLHYGVWVLAVPAIAVRTAPWNVSSTPLARRSPAIRRALVGVVALGAVIMISLWGAFLVDYPFTRDLYFTVALLHVLAEAPMLLRVL